MRIGIPAACVAVLCVLASADPVDAAAAQCPKMSETSLVAWQKLATTKDPVLDALYGKQTRIVDRIKRLAESDDYSLESYRALQGEHDEIKIAMERRRSENTAAILKALSSADQRQVLLSLYGGC